MSSLPGKLIPICVKPLGINWELMLATSKAPRRALMWLKVLMEVTKENRFWVRSDG